MTTDPMHVAVYGTLRKGQAAARKMIDCEYVGLERVKGSMYNLGWFPGIKLEIHGTNRFTAELYKLPTDYSDILADLDAYEGYVPDDPAGSLYIRKTIRINGLVSYIYEIKHTPLASTRILSGDWTRR